MQPPPRRTSSASECALREDLAPAAEWRRRHRSAADGALRQPSGAALAAAEVQTRGGRVRLGPVATHDAEALLLGRLALLLGCALVVLGRSLFLGRGVLDGGDDAVRCRA